MTRPLRSFGAWTLTLGFLSVAGLAAFTTGCGGEPASCDGAGCVTLALSGPASLPGGTLDDVTVILRRGGKAERHTLRDRVVRLPAQLSLPLPAASAEPDAHLGVTVRGRFVDRETRQGLGASVELQLTGSALPLQLVRTDEEGPGARAGAALGFDPRSRRLILVGGRRGAAVLADSWAWDGARWSRLPEPGLPARSGHALALDPVRGRLLLFGGRGQDGAPLGDTWSYEGAGWQRLSTAGPPPRSAAALAPVAADLLLSGGLGAGDVGLGDTWRWDGASWSEAAPVDPCPPDAPLAPSGPRCRGGAVLLPLAGQAFLFGGLLGPRPLAGLPARPEVDDVAWRWDGAAWSAAPSDMIASASAAALLARHHHAATALSTTQALIGAGDSSGGLRQDFYVLEATTGRARPLLGPAPTPRAQAALAYDPDRDEAILTGGRGAAGELADAWSFHLDAGWSPLP